ncbi:hypothetical protein H0N99_01415 [Candidatus Micrarchaeota archaeon]|nr:hypothetical protein [Candidatus Micrarchaeota archaeon]
MKKGKPTISREPVATMEQDKPVPSMRGALVLIFITLALLLAIYILSLLSSGKVNPYIPPNQPPQQQNWTLSPLVARYDPMNVTPVIIINCKYMRVGSHVLTNGDEAEREVIGQALCTATNSSTFCSKFGRTVLTTLNFPECKSGNKILIYAFHSPSCSISSEQRNVLDAFRDEFQHDVAVEYICTPRGEQDKSPCAYQFSIGRYNQ